MTEADGEDRRTIAADGTQVQAQPSPTAGRSAGPAPSVGGDQEPGGPVPPYEGRRESADIDSGGADREGAHVGGATGPRVDSQTVAEPESTPLGRSASPADGGDETEVADYPADPGVGPAHQAGVRKGEDTPE